MNNPCIKQIKSKVLNKFKHGKYLVAVESHQIWCLLITYFLQYTLVILKRMLLDALEILAVSIP